MITTIKTFKNCGPYYDSERYDYTVDTLSNFIRQVRIIMEDNDAEIIGIYNDDVFVGGWTLEGDYEPDYDNGGYYCVSAEYLKARPHSFDWNCIQRFCCTPGTPIKLTNPIT